MGCALGYLCPFFVLSINDNEITVIQPFDMMNILILAIVALLVLLLIGFVLYLLFPRKYQSADSVDNSYDDWTNDGILEFYWGEHIHLRHHVSQPRATASLKANADIVHAVLHRGVLDQPHAAL